MRSLEEQEECKQRLITFACEYLNTSQREWALRAGLSAAFIKTFTGVLRRDTRVKIEKTYPQLNLDWVLSGEGDMIKKDVQSVTNTQTKIIIGDFSGNSAEGDQIVSGDKASMKAEILALKAELRAKQAQIESQQEMIRQLIEQISK